MSPARRSPQSSPAAAPLVGRPAGKAAERPPPYLVYFAGDLWGPLVICILLATLLSVSSPADQAATVFCAVFGIVWVGAAVVTLNAQLLEGERAPRVA